MDGLLELDVKLGRPAVRAGEEPKNPVYARLRVGPGAAAPARPRLDVSFVLDASASMHHFFLNPDQRAYWRQRAQARGEISLAEADGHTGLVWRGQTLRELQQHVSTPMLSSLRGVWRAFEALRPSDRAAVFAFADKAGQVYADDGVPDQAGRLQAAKAALSTLGSGVDESGLGRGTRLVGALRAALDRIASADGAVVLHRMVLVSDGIVEDAEACKALVDQAQERGLVVSVIGVGDEFDEEFLMRIADVTRGAYYYAATALEVEQAIRVELDTIGSIIARQGVLRVRPENGTIIHDVYPVAPSIAQFQTMWVENGSWRFRIGDLSAVQPAEFLLEMSPAAQPSGDTSIATVLVEGLAPQATERVTADCPVKLFYSDEAVLLQARNDEVMDAVRRLEVYLEERRAAEAAARGDYDASTRHLRSATRMLRGMGAEGLADDMEAAAADAESGTRNLSRTKRVKAGTRRLGAR